MISKIFLGNFFSSCSLKLLRVLFSREPRLLNRGPLVLYSLGGSREEGSERSFPRNIVFESSPSLKSELCCRYPKAFAFSVQRHRLIQENNVSFSQANASVVWGSKSVQSLGTDFKDVLERMSVRFSYCGDYRNRMKLSKAKACERT